MEGQASGEIRCHRGKDIPAMLVDLPPELKDPKMDIYNAIIEDRKKVIDRANQIFQEIYDENIERKTFALEVQTYPKEYRAILFAMLDKRPTSRIEFLAVKTFEDKYKEKPLEGNSTLIITEKPQAASKISMALSNGKARQTKSSPGVYYYEFQKNGENIIVTCAVGHLFSLSQDIKGSNYPIFDISWKPNYEVRKKDFTRKYYNAMENHSGNKLS